MSGDDSSPSLRAPVPETVFRPFPLASPSSALYLERMFLLRLCTNQPIHYLRLLSIHIFQQASLQYLGVGYASGLWKTTRRLLVAFGVYSYNRRINVYAWRFFENMRPKHRFSLRPGCGALNIEKMNCLRKCVLDQINHVPIYCNTNLTPVSTSVLSVRLTPGFSGVS